MGRYFLLSCVPIASSLAADVKRSSFDLLLFRCPKRNKASRGKKAQEMEKEKKSNLFLPRTFCWHPVRFVLRLWQSVSALSLSVSTDPVRYFSANKIVFYLRAFRYSIFLFCVDTTIGCHFCRFPRDDFAIDQFQHGEQNLVGLFA